MLLLWEQLPKRVRAAVTPKRASVPILRLRARLRARGRIYARARALRLCSSSGASSCSISLGGAEARLIIQSLWARIKRETVLCGHFFGARRTRAPFFSSIDRVLRSEYITVYSGSDASGGGHCCAFLPLMPQGKRIYAAEGFRVFMLFILIVPGAANRGAGSVLFVYFNDFYTLYSISAAKYRKVVRVCKEGVIFRTTAQQNNA